MPSPMRAAAQPGVSEFDICPVTGITISYKEPAPSEKMIIRKASFLHTIPDISDGGRGGVKLMLARSKSVEDKFYMPGGKIDPGETGEQACVREIEEECGVTIDLDHFELDNLGTYCGEAHGKPGVKLEITVYRAILKSESPTIEDLARACFKDGKEPKASAEIAEIKYFTYAGALDKLPETAGKVVRNLHYRGIV